MTPKEEFAAKRLEAEQLIQKHAPERLQSQLIALLRPAIALSATRTEDEQIPLSASKFGGAPDVPSDFEWPMWNDKPLGFLAQMDLEEVAPFDAEELLPKSGLLLFFYDFEEMPWGGEKEDVGSWRVFWFDEPLNRTSPPEEISELNRDFLPSCLISFETEWTIPDTWELKEDLDDATFDQYTNFFSMLGRQQNIHRVFGHTNNIQDPVMQIEEMRRCGLTDYNKHREEIQQGAKEWALLLQVDSDSQLPQMWGDCGTLYFAIRKEDLANKRFDKTTFALQCG